MVFGHKTTVMYNSKPSSKGTVQFTNSFWGSANLLNLHESSYFFSLLGESFSTHTIPEVTPWRQQKGGKRYYKRLRSRRYQVAIEFKSTLLCIMTMCSKPTGSSFRVDLEWSNWILTMVKQLLFSKHGSLFHLFKIIITAYGYVSRIKGHKPKHLWKRFSFLTSKYSKYWIFYHRNRKPLNRQAVAVVLSNLPKGGGQMFTWIPPKTDQNGAEIGYPNGGYPGIPNET